MASATPAMDLWAVSPASLGLDARKLGRLWARLNEDIDAGRLPGAVALVARRGRVAAFEALGQRAPGVSGAMHHDAIFRIYSMSKPVVSLAAMMLLEEGRLQLADPLHQYLPEFRHMTVGAERAPAQHDITLHDLLRHTAGLGYEFVGEGPLQQLYAEHDLAARTRTNAEFTQALATLPLWREPGSGWGYSRATDVLGRVIEVVSGQSLGAFLRQRIFGPLDMRDTGFSVPPEQQHRIAEPFAVDPVTGQAAALFDPRDEPRLESGGGGLMSTAADYARFLQLILQGGRLGEVALLGRKTVSLMMHDHLGPQLPRGDDVLVPGHGFGLGFSVRESEGMAPVNGSAGLCHWSGIAGTTFFVDPSEQLFGMLLIQAPHQREHFRTLFRNMVYAALVD
ncbi:MAG: Esterase EstB [Pseudomonadota bacterium]|jgi:CubicO group peptidase (beta-lactamase class C family)